MTRTRIAPSSLMLAVTLATLAGCGLAPNSVGAVARAHTSVAAPAAHTAAAPATASANNMLASTLLPVPGVGTSPTVNTYTAQIDILTGQITGTLPATASVPLAATSGGHYESADGKIGADFPPGSLIGNANVSIIPLDTSATPVTAAFIPALSFKLDLGGAMLAPDAVVQVTAPVDPRLVAELQQRDPHFDATRYGLRQDATGAWLMQMAVHGPQTQPDLALGTPASGLQIAEFGALPLPVAARKLTGLVEKTGTSTADDCAQWTSIQGAAVPGSMADFSQLYPGAGFLTCGINDNTVWYAHIYSDLQNKLPTCQATVGPSPTPSATTSTPGTGAATPTTATSAAPAAPVMVAIPSHVRFTSDDPSVDGTDAVGVDVRYDFTLTPTNGPRDVVTDAQGAAASSTLAGLSAALTPYMSLGPVVGSAVTVTATAGMAPVELTVAKNSPAITLDLTSDTTLGGTLALGYTLDGTPAKLSLALPTGGNSATLHFSVRLPDDGEHAFAITGGSNTDDVQALRPFPTASVHRNGTYELPLHLVNMIAK